MGVSLLDYVWSSKPTERCRPRLDQGEVQGKHPLGSTATLTLVLLIPNDNEEGNAGAKSVDHDGHLTQHTQDSATNSPYHFLVGAFIAGLGAVGQDDQSANNEEQQPLQGRQRRAGLAGKEGGAPRQNSPCKTQTHTVCSKGGGGKATHSPQDKLSGLRMDAARRISGQALGTPEGLRGGSQQWPLCCLCLPNRALLLLLLGNPRPGNKPCPAREGSGRPWASTGPLGPPVKFTPLPFCSMEGSQSGRWGACRVGPASPSEGTSLLRCGERSLSQPAP